jgi:hypothetical protein
MDKKFAGNYPGPLYARHPDLLKQKMKTLSQTDWKNIEEAFELLDASLNPKFTTIEGIKQQIEEAEVGGSVHYIIQNAPFELGEDGKPLPQFDEQGNNIPIFIVQECVVIENDA